jgi:CDP-diacylglycerol--glycerol-3-phosphate 3-phosphatidyltransferase
VNLIEPAEGRISGFGRKSPPSRAPLYACSVATRPVPLTLAQLPNALTVARFVLIPVFIALMLSADGGHSWGAATVFGVAGITDQVDGWLARRWRVESEFGKYADPLADRLMIDVAVLLLFLDSRLPWVALVVIVARDALLIGGARFAMPRGYEFSVSFLGKAATWLLYAGVGFLIADRWDPDWPRALFWAGVATALAAAAVYVYSAWRSVR